MRIKDDKQENGLDIYSKLSKLEMNCIWQGEFIFCSYLRLMGEWFFKRTPFAGICGNLLELHSTGFCLTRGTLAGTRNTDTTLRSLYNQSHLRLHPSSMFSLIISTFNPLSVYMTYSVCPDFRPSDAYMMYWVRQNFKRSCQTPGTQETTFIGT